MSKTYLSPRGTADILPDEAAAWLEIERKARRLFHLYRYCEIRTPVFEETALFSRSIGETSDIVQKQMLHLAPPVAGEGAPRLPVFSLRPEGTASVVRAYIQHRLDQREPLSKLYYIGPMFRGERPQKGRLRQFHQIGVEALGPASTSPALDAEVIALSAAVLDAAGVADVRLRVNTLGSLEDKEALSGFLRRVLETRRSGLCPDCRDRFERNVFRILDCKRSTCRGIVAGLPLIEAPLTAASRAYFSRVLDGLEALGVRYVRDPTLVRGLDYYTHTVFELTSRGLGSQDAVGAGGRYDGLAAQLGGPSVAAVGFALGIERMLLAARDAAPISSGPQVFLIPASEGAERIGMSLLAQLRRAGLAADMAYRSASLKALMRQAHKSGALRVGILGEEECREECLTVKNMETGEQRRVSWARAADEISAEFARKGMGRS